MASLLDLSKEELVAIILDLRKRLEALEVEVARLRKNSSNSSKPPSSDIVKPPKPPAPSGRRKRRIGGQPGHPRYDRAAFAPDEINRTRGYELHRCPGCGGRLKRLADRDRIIQQVEIVRAPVTVAYLRDALHAHLNNRPVAALLPAGPSGANATRP